MEDKFWLWIWAVLAAAFIAFVGIIGGCTMQQQKLIAESPDPVAASCAINGNQTVCTAVLMREAHK